MAISNDEAKALMSAAQPGSIISPPPATAGQSEVHWDLKGYTYVVALDKAKEILGSEWQQKLQGDERLGKYTKMSPFYYDNGVVINENKNELVVAKEALDELAGAGAI